MQVIMITASTCQQCSQLPAPPPIFSVGPPPNLFSLDIHCSSRLLSSIQHKTIISSASSSSIPITLGIIIALLISTGAILLIKNRLIKQRRRQRKYDDSSLSVKFNGHDDHQNRTKFIPLLSDSCSSDRSPTNDYPCGIFEPFLLNHEYEQINSDYYCLIYCRQCGNYHQTSRVSCTCHLRNENHLLELQPTLKVQSEYFNH